MIITLTSGALTHARTHRHTRTHRHALAEMPAYGQRARRSSARFELARLDSETTSPALARLSPLPFQPSYNNAQQSSSGDVTRK